VMVADYLDAPGPLTVTVSDGWHTLEVTFVLVLEDPSEPYDLTVTYTEANENIFVSFKVDGELDLQPIGGLDNPETDNTVIAGKYFALGTAIEAEDDEAIKAAALAIGDDILIEYFYMENDTKVYLETINNNDLIKNKYWNRFLVREGDNNRFPDWAEGETIIVADTLHRTNTNPGTGSVAEGWLDEAKGKDVYVAVTVLNNGGVNTIVETVSIPEPEPDGIQISTWDDLDDVRNNPGEDYVLVNNLDSNTEGYADLASSSANDGKGWEPIEPAAIEDWFHGIFDGNGYSISDLYINRPDEERVGLFGAINSGTLKNISLVDVDVTGLNRVGGLAGQAIFDSEISNCSSSGNVTGLEASGAGGTGGLVGLAWHNTQIKDCHSTAEVVASHNVGGLLGLHLGEQGFAGNPDGAVIRSWASGNVYGNKDIGGLVGNARAPVEIRESFATGNVTHTPEGEGHYAGGLIGISSGSIVNCYATGDVSGAALVGGLAGKAVNEVLNSYSTGQVSFTVTTWAGGFIGNGAGCDVINSYWNTETSGQPDYPDWQLGTEYEVDDYVRVPQETPSNHTIYRCIKAHTADETNEPFTATYWESIGVDGGGEGRTTAEMIQQATFVDWDFSDIWTIEEDVSYPTLKWE